MAKIISQTLYVIENLFLYNQTDFFFSFNNLYFYFMFYSC